MTISSELWSIPSGTTVATTISKSPLSLSFKTLPPRFNRSSHNDRPQFSISSTPYRSLSTGLCKATQLMELFPTLSPNNIVVREARIEDCWEVAETHCSSFFPQYSFPLDFALRIDRLIGMLFGFGLPGGCKRVCLVADIGSSSDDTFGSEHLKIRGFDGKFSLNRGYVAGILTVDTVGDFLPRKGPLRQRRKGIAYISNVAVRERYRQKGIAKKLVAKAESQARSWGCRAIALHCDLNSPGATMLYKGQGFTCVKVPEGAKWPSPKTSPNMQLTFMMKLLRASDASMASTS